jgi:hypothetical protein
MIKIIKEGRTDFTLTCDHCGCIFAYNVEDIDDSYIKCPTCHKMHYAFQESELTSPEELSKIAKSTAITTQCTDCPTFKLLQSGKTYVGDLPCQWCSANPLQISCACTCSDSARCDDGIKVTCSAEGVSYETTLESCVCTECKCKDNTNYTWTVPDLNYSEEQAIEYYNICENANGGTYCK